ncbi:MAG TPA: hypothetical protein VLG10_10725 [Methylomirabilota bacterium]|nr:hypothetical protein [Methylomirabilota bacterium]
MSGERSLEGWAPRVGDEVQLAEVIDLAFDYRGDVTVVLTHGRDLVGYVYNRNRDVTEPYLQLFDPSGTAHTLRYTEIRTIRFTGRDTAAGTSYEAWLRRKGETRPA